MDRSLVAGAAQEFRVSTKVDATKIIFAQLKILQNYEF
jgi:hypothetical protein